MAYRIKTTKSKGEVQAILRTIPGAIKGTGPDPYGFGEAYRAGFLHSLMTSIYESFLIKSAGGTDETGHSWPQNSPETNAYHKLSLRAGISLPGNKRRPTLTKEQEAYWKAVFISELTSQESNITSYTKREPRRASDRRRLGYPTSPPKGGILSRAKSFLSRKGGAIRAYFLGPTNEYNAFIAALSMEGAEARHLAAAKAWNMVKAKMGATTLIEILGNSRSNINLETGRLLDSYDPGPFRIPFLPMNRDQQVSLIGSKLVVNSAVPYKPRKGSPRSVVSPNPGIWIKRAKLAGKQQLIRRLEEVL